MAARAAHVTMVQRSPSYVVSLPGQDPIADFLRRRLPASVAYPLVRWKNVLLTTGFYKLSRRAPGFVKRLIRRGVERHLPAGYDVDTHFKPRYDPWDQRVCLVPDGDLFEAIRRGDASIVTDHVESFTEKGVRLASGDEVEADVIVTATGLNVLMLGGMEIAVDDREIKLPETVTYKGMMLCGVPNFAYTVGYTNASWTLKADLVARYVCRLLRHMEERGYRVCTPRAPDPTLPTEPLLDLTSGYVLRSIDDLPRQGGRVPWRLHQNYARDKLMLGLGSLEDEAMEFSRVESAVPAKEQLAA
jgi:cation diffusion facilitator CzcD-associated flavoprotein CzcO